MSSKKGKSGSSKRSQQMPKLDKLVVEPRPKPLASSPQIVENTLKEFHDYLKFIQDKLQQQQERQERRFLRRQQEATTREGDGEDESVISWNAGVDDTATATSGSQAPHNQLLWTYERDTKRYLQRLDQFRRVLMEQIDRFPLHSKAGREILQAIQSAAKRSSQLQIAADVSMHVRQMKLYVSRLLQEIQLVDLDALIATMQHNQRAGEQMAGEEVILLCGATRAGKTTTLHFLAGSTLEEVEVEGFFHLHPTAVADSAVANYKTTVGDSSDNKNNQSVATGTGHLQTARIRMAAGEDNNPRTVVVCDTPGLGQHDPQTQTVEWEIANGLGMVRAIHRAKTVKLAWVINREEVRIRERFFTNTSATGGGAAGLEGETVASMKRLLSKSPELDLGPFNYLFTRYEAKHRDCLCRQFSVMSKNYGNHNNQNEPTTTASTTGYSTTGDGTNSSVGFYPTSIIGDGDHTTVKATPPTPAEQQQQRDAERDTRLMKKVLEDIVKKTTPKANIVLPLQDDPKEFLQELWESCRTIHDPKKFFVPFVSYPALKKLQLQLRITLSDLRTSLVEEDQTTAVYRLRQLQALAGVLPEAKDCANLGVEAVKKHMTGLRSRVLASMERKDYSMAIHRAQQLVTLSDVLPEAKTYGTITHDAVLMLRDLMSALQQTDYKTCLDRMGRLSELAREFPEANKCAYFALKASIQHVTDFREKVIKLVDSALEAQDVKKFTSLLETLGTTLGHVVASEPLLLLCVKEDYVGLDKQEHRAMQQLSFCTSEAFCIDQVQRLTDRLRQDIPNFQAKSLNMEDLLKKKDIVLVALERLKIVSVVLIKSPAGARADSLYHQAFKSFHDLVSGILTDAEAKYKSTWTDLDVLGRKVWFVAVLLQGPLKNKPYTARKELIRIEDLERRVLKLMLRLEIEVTRSIERLKNFKFPDTTKANFMRHSSTPDFGISELKAPRFLLISVAKNARIRKLLPSKLDVLEMNVCIAMFDHALLSFWKRVVARLEQDYAVIVAMQKVQKDPQDILLIARQLRTDIARVEKEFLGICGWSDDITAESESDLKRLIAVRDCVQMGVTKMEETAQKLSVTGMNSLFACGNLNSVDGANRLLCSTRPKASPE